VANCPVKCLKNNDLAACHERIDLANMANSILTAEKTAGGTEAEKSATDW
jgi:hypothetical protein